MLCEVEKCVAFTVGVLRKFLCPVPVREEEAKLAQMMMVVLKVNFIG